MTGNAAPRGPGRDRTGNPVPERDVEAMFDQIAPVYDRLNSFLSLRADGRWRRLAVQATGLEAGDAALDVACGTGKLAVELAGRVGPFGTVVGVDVSAAMIEHARVRNRDLIQLEFRRGNALALPFEDASFDAVTIAFGLRNLADFRAGFGEMARVTRPGGRVVCLELSVPRPRVLGRLFHGAFRRAAPIAGRLHGVRGPYRYLPDSLDGFPEPAGLARLMADSGLVDIARRGMALGAVTMLVGNRPAHATLT